MATKRSHQKRGGEYTVIPLKFEVPIITGAIVERYSTDPWSATALVAGLDDLVWARDVYREVGRISSGRSASAIVAAFNVTVHVAPYDADGTRLTPKSVGAWCARLVEFSDGCAVGYALGLDNFGNLSADELLIRLNISRFGAFEERVRQLAREIEGVRVEQDGEFWPPLGKAHTHGL